jgi:hypothetical protein
MTEPLKRLELSDAIQELGIVVQEEKTYVLPGLIIKVLAEGLEVTLVPQSRKRNFPRQTFTVSEPFEYSYQDQVYFFVCANGQLEIWKRP